jgi:IS30 family transposase
MTTVTAGLKRVMPRLPAELRKALTWDRGMELADHKNVAIDTGLSVYFADPRSPGSEAPTRTRMACCGQYLPKGQSMAGLTQDDLDAIAAKLNSRPRRSLDYETPADRLAALLR